MKRIIGIFTILCACIFNATMARAACSANEIDVAGDASNCQTAKFTVTTTNLTTGETFSFYMSATGTFYIDCGAGGTLSGTGASGKTVIRTDTTEAQYTCTYSTAGTKDIRMGGAATGYNTERENYHRKYAAIRFGGEGSDAAKITSIAGSIGQIFSTLGASDAQQPVFYATFAYSNITSIPENLFSGVTGGGNAMFRRTFMHCASLTSIPENLFTSITGGGDNVGYKLFDETFGSCTALTSIPANLFSNVIYSAGDEFFNTFYHCTSLTTIPAGLFRNIVPGISVGYMFYGTFRGCTSLTTIPSNLFSNITSAADYTFYYTFGDCTSLTTIPSGLFSNVNIRYTTSDCTFCATFYGCTSLTSIPENLFSGVTIGAKRAFNSTFNGCTSLSGYIPPSAFAGLIANGHPTATDMWLNTFANTNVATSCSGYTNMAQYTTGYESDWDGRVACVDMCNAGYYLDENYQCAACDTDAAYYCPGDNTKHDCPTIDDNFYQWAYDTYGITQSPGLIQKYWTSSATLKTSIEDCVAYHEMSSDTALRIYFSVKYNTTFNLYRSGTYNLLYRTARPGYYLKQPKTSNNDLFRQVTACTNAPAHATYTGVGTNDTYDGTVVDANDCPWECDAGYYNNNGTCTACPTGYTSNAGATAENQCFITVTGGHYIGTAGQNNTNWETCAAGYARAEHTVNYGSTSSCTACKGTVGTNGRPQYSNAGASSCTECPAVTGELASRATGSYTGWWGANNVGPNNTINGCIAYFYDDDPDATYMTYCYYNKIDGGYGGSHSSCYINNHSSYVTGCVAGKYNTITSTSEWYSSSNYARCEGVDCMKGKVCTPCPENTYSPDGATTCTACPTGLYSPAGMSNANQCGHILHVGDAAVYLHGTKKTSPAVHVKIGNDIFYGNMTTADVVMHAGTAHKLKVNFGGQTYSIYDDTVTVP